ncbi:phospho-N-acetylmuramoyl-pentapeptide-transferase [Thermosulfuriphilus sp.]
MLYHLLYPLHDWFGPFNVFRYITFRTIYATITAIFITFALMPWFIAKVRAWRIGQIVREEGPQSHRVKTGTPTMGGIVIILAVAISTLLWANLTNVYVWLALFSLFAFGAIGLYDDWRKVSGRRNLGLTGRVKLFFQALAALAIGGHLYYHGFDTTLAVPFFKGFRPELGVLYLIFVLVVIVGASNAVNLTDGLDGLAIGPYIISAATYLLFAYLAGHAQLAAYLQIPYVAGTGELAVFCGALVGAGLGFLWYNAYPAEIFMGDVGALSLGGALGTVAVLVKQEILLAIVGGVFVAEAISVMLQVASFRLTGRRIFRMAPLHHHFELKGWPEPKVIVRFWIVSAILGMAAISTLKLR